MGLNKILRNGKRQSSNFLCSFVKNTKCYFIGTLNGDNKYIANDICKVIDFLMDNIYVRFGGQLF